MLPYHSNSHHHYGADLPPGARALAAYAASAVPSQGRLVPEASCPTRSDMQRDRDRIVHSSAFRRLTYKTQVFVYHEGDNYRTRLTHSLEVAQIARTIARQLCLDEDLAEAIALAHDLGHPPFGHAGERAMDEALQNCGGFDHNVQSFRVVHRLERKYNQFDGLNLCWETLEGLIKHNGPLLDETGRADLHPGASAMRTALADWPQRMDLQIARQASAEAQVAALADDIAWHTHDIDDGLRARLLTMDQIADVPLIAPIMDMLRRRAQRDPARDIYEITRQLITLTIADVVRESRERLAALAPASPDDIRAHPAPVIAFSQDMRADLKVLRAFLFDNLYRHQKVTAIMEDAARIVHDLIARYEAQPEAMLDTWRARSQGKSGSDRLRVVGDFVAGMTDRFALAEHKRLFDATPQLR